jgi:hypothetical protein
MPQLSSWHVLPHGPIEKLAPNLWRVEGTLKGMPLKRVMTIAKRTDGSLVVHNAVAMREEQMRELEAFGEVRHVIVPSGYHRLDAAAFQARYPNAKFYAPPGALKRVQQRVPGAQAYAAYPSDEATSLEVLAGLAETEGALFVRSSDGVTLVLNDAMFNMPHLHGLQGLILKYLTQSSGGPRVSRIARLALIKDKAAFRAELLRLSALPGLVRIIVAHHETVDRDAPRVLREVAATV